MSALSSSRFIAEIFGRIGAFGPIKMSIGDIRKCAKPADVPRLLHAILRMREIHSPRI